MNASVSAPGSQAGLRESNRLRVIRALQTHGAMTQVEIAGTTGLSPATVSNLVKDLDANDSVRVEPSIRNGRRAVLVSLPLARQLVAGIAFGERDVRVAIGTGPRDLTGTHRMPLPSDHRADESVERAVQLLLDLVETAGMTRAELCALTIGVPAPIDPDSGRVGSDGIMPGWSGVDLRQELQSVLGAPVLVENTANLAAIGELKLGSLRGVETGVYLKVSHGVGAGLIIGGRLFRGSTGTAGQLGHVTMDEHGPMCRCGNRGCLETYIGSRAILDALVRTHGSLTLRDVVGRVVRGDAACIRVVEDAGRHLGLAVANLVNLFNPQVVVLGGPFARVADVMFAPMRAALDRGVMSSAAAAVELRASTLDADADIIGALVLSESAAAALPTSGS